MSGSILYEFFKRRNAILFTGKIGILSPEAQALIRAATSRVFVNAVSTSVAASATTSTATTSSVLSLAVSGFAGVGLFLTAGALFLEQQASDKLKRTTAFTLLSPRIKSLAEKMYPDRDLKSLDPWKEVFSQNGLLGESKKKFGSDFGGDVAKAVAHWWYHDLPDGDQLSRPELDVHPLLKPNEIKKPVVLEIDDPKITDGALLYASSGDASTANVDASEGSGESGSEEKVKKGKMKVINTLEDPSGEAMNTINTWPDDLKARFFSYMSDSTLDQKELLKEIEGIDEFLKSLSADISPTAYWRRIAATPEEAARFHKGFIPKVSEMVTLELEGEIIQIDRATLEKMDEWVSQHSKGLTIETNGWFQYRKQGDQIIIEDFIPAASFSFSIEYARESRGEKFGGEGVMATMVFQNRGIEKYFAEFDDVDPIHTTNLTVGNGPKTYIHFHSHFTASAYQNRPSDPDFEACRGKIRFLATPGSRESTDRSNLILYRGFRKQKKRGRSLFGGQGEKLETPKQQQKKLSELAIYNLPASSYIPEKPLNVSGGGDQIPENATVKTIKAGLFE